MGRSAAHSLLRSKRGQRENEAQRGGPVGARWGPTVCYHTVIGDTLYGAARLGFQSRGQARSRREFGGGPRANRASTLRRPLFEPVGGTARQEYLRAEPYIMKA